MTLNRGVRRGQRDASPLTSWRSSDVGTSGAPRTRTSTSTTSAVAGAATTTGLGSRTTRTSLGLALRRSRSSRHAQYRSVRQAPRPSRSANSLHVRPLARHAATRFAQVFASAMPRTIAAGDQRATTVLMHRMLISSSVVSLLAQEAFRRPRTGTFPQGTRATPPLASWRCSEFSTSEERSDQRAKRLAGRGVTRERSASPIREPSAR
jgi:hypothetical protein